MKIVGPRARTSTQEVAKASWYQRAESMMDVLGPIAGFYLCGVPALLAWRWYDQDPSTIRRYVAVMTMLNAFATVYGLARRKGWQWIALVWMLPGSFLYPWHGVSRRYWYFLALVVIVLVGTWWWQPNGGQSGREVPSHLLHQRHW